MKTKWMILLLPVCLLLAGCAGSANGPDGAPTPDPDATLPPVVIMSTPAPTRAIDPEAAEDAAERRLAAMTDEEKVYQALLFCCHDAEEADRAAACGVGGICLYADAFAGKSREEVCAMTAALQEASPLPLLLAVDEEGGTVCRVSLNRQLRATSFDAPARLYERGGWTLVETDAAEKSRLLLELGLNVNLAPVADVPLNQANYIYPRCFSTDPEQTAAFVGRVVSVMKHAGIGSTLKHFPGYGGSADTHRGTARDERSYTAFTEGDFLPFIAGIEAGADAVLVSHNLVACMDDQNPASLSPEVHRILREELGFAGVVLCDDLGMAAVRPREADPEPVLPALLAGNDLISCSDFEAAAQAILAALADGSLPAERLDEAVLRVLRWKLSLGLEWE